MEQLLNGRNLGQNLRRRMTTTLPSPKDIRQPESAAGLAAPLGSASWSKAEIHFGMAKAAWKLAARNEHGAAMVIEHMERAIETLKAMTPNEKLTDAGPETPGLA